MAKRSTRFLLTAALCVGVLAPAWGQAPTAPAGPAAAAEDTYDIFVLGASSSDLNAKLAGTGLWAEAVAGGTVVKPSLPLRDAVALSKHLANEGMNVQLRHAAATRRGGFEDGQRAYERGDYDAALREWLPLASGGNAAAQYYLGRMYSIGQGVLKDDSEALRWFRLAAEQRDARAQVRLGWIYYVGHGVPKDYAEAGKWFGRAAVQGDALAQYTLGVMYEHGEGVSRDDREAATWFRRAAEQDYVLAQVKLGFMYSEGRGVPKDAVESARWLRRAAEQGNTLAELGLGQSYYSGLGVLQDYGEAARWYRRAAEQGETEAQFALGVVSEKGEGLPQDYGESVKWYRLAADQGHARAQVNLGRLYFLGRGAAQDDIEAARWFRRAAQQGEPRGQQFLGGMYECGCGVPQDYELAYLWYNLAASRSAGQDREDTSRKRDQISRRLTPAQIASAQRAAREWEPTPEERRPTSSQDRHTALEKSDPQRAPMLDSTGTGFIVSKRGHVLTAHHVIDGCDEVRTGPHFGDRRATSVVARDPKNDLALLKLSSPTPSAASFREGRGIRPGDAVVVVGFPLRGLLSSAPSLTTGVVSALAGPRDDTRLLQITAPVQPGNSGGPLLDQGGNVVGVVVSKLDALKVAEAIGDIPQNVNFAIHANVARTFLEANGVTYEMAPSTKALETADIGERARSFAVVVECWNTASEVTRGRE